MRLHVLSDVHRDHSGEIALPTVDADVVILEGDVDGGFDSLRWAMRSFTPPTLFVLDNHEIVAGNEEKLVRRSRSGQVIRRVSDPCHGPRSRPRGASEGWFS